MTLQMGETMQTGLHVSRRALEEIYFPPFRRALTEAGAGSVMGSYNQVNGQPACGNGELLSTILREQLGFAGWVMSDWDATHSTDSVVKGLDMEMPLGVLIVRWRKIVLTVRRRVRDMLLSFLCAYY